jgi:glycosyltransferase involved in cell wall biosynthesis
MSLAQFRKSANPMSSRAVRFIALQTGARHNYAVPATLAKAGILEAFYTDMCGSVGVGAIPHILPFKRQPKAWERLSSRKVPEILKDKVKTSDRATLAYRLRKRLACHHAIKQHDALRTFNHEFAQSMIRKGLGEATHIFSMFGEGTDFLEFAKQRGLQVITDIYISPATHRIVQAVRAEYPDLEPQISQEIIDRDYQYFDRVCRLSDMFLAPSEFVLDGLAEFGVDRAKCRILPYAVGDEWFQVQNQPIKGQILFVGTAELRKGIHLLGMAAQQLQSSKYEFKIAGGVSDQIRTHKLTQNLEFLGRVARTEIDQEFAQADIFVLPTLAEGSASVIYEALAVGLPVITTHAAGSVIRDGVEGFIVPEGDSAMLTARIQELVENRELRNQMSIAARERARAFTWESYSRSLLEILVN